MDHQQTEILITVRAYPVPSTKYVETSCVAGVDLRTSSPIRIFPIRARLMNDPNSFKKWSVISGRVTKARRDHRPESHNIDQDSIKVERQIGTENGWRERRDLLKPFRNAESIEELLTRIDKDGKESAPGLSLIKPKSIDRLVIQHKGREDWTNTEIAKLQQQSIFDRDSSPRQQLGFVPYAFKYQFTCNDPKCGGHEMSVIDWEAGQSYRKWRKKYGDEHWEEKFREKYWNELVESKDLQFFVGTQQKRPKTWSIIGIFYPPHPARDEQYRTRSLF